MALRLRGATSGYIELKAPASAGDNTLTLPVNNGSANQLLKTDGSGNLSWVDDNSGVSLSGSTNNTIATVTGANALQGEGNLTFDGTNLNLPSVNTWIKGGGHSVLQVDATMSYFYGGSGGAQFRKADNSSPLIQVLDDGKVGIGTTSPATTLHVDGTASVGYDATHALRFYNQAKNNWSSISNNIATGTSNAQLAFRTGAGEAMRILHDGKVGIGTTSPNRILSVKGNGGQMSIVDDDDSMMQFYVNSGTGAIWATGGGGTDGSLDFATTPNGGSTVSRLIIKKGGETHFTRQADGGTVHVGNTAGQWFKVGTWSGPSVSSAARCNITVLGTDTHNSGANLGGETKIYLGFDSANVCRGTYHSITGGFAGLIGVAHKYDSTAKSLEIWVRYQGGYGMTQCFADVSSGFFAGTSVATGSTSVPAGATELGSDYRLLTSNGTNSLTTLSCSGSTQNVSVDNGNLGFGTANKGITLGTTSIGTDANTLDDYEEGNLTWQLRKSGSTSTGSDNGSNVKYTKVGRLVHISGRIRTDSTPGDANQYFYMDGTLPFTPATSGTAVVGHFRSQDQTDSSLTASISWLGSSSTIYIYTLDSKADYSGTSNNTPASSQTNLVATFSLTYQAT